MSGFNFGIYTAMGITFVLLGVWRLTRGGKTGGTLRLASFLIGFTILAIMAGSLLGVVSLKGVEECLNDKGGGRSKLFVCLFHTRLASP